LQNPTTYTVESKTFILKAPESVAEFKGWKNQNGEIVDKIIKGTQGDIILTAQWPEELNSFNYSLTKNDCVISGFNKNISNLFIPNYISSIDSLHSLVVDLQV